MKKAITFFFITISLCLSGQKIYKGTIIDKTTKKGISYATIGLLKENIGCNADENGKFTLQCKGFSDDTIIISSAGYSTSKFPVHYFSEHPLLEIEERFINLPTVFVSNASRKKILKLNEFHECGDWNLVTSGYQSQIAQQFNLPGRNSELQSINICTNNKIVGLSSAVFRIRVYGIDSLSKYPGNDLCSEIIEVKSDKKFISINVEKFHIIIPDSIFFIAIEWLKIPANKAQGSNNATYGPPIGMKNSKLGVGKSWILSYNNIWYARKESDASISVSVRY